MKIRAWTEGPVELEAEVEFEDMLSEIASIVEEGKDYPNRLVAAMVQVTRILMRVENDWIARMKPEHRAEIARRLRVEADRYLVPMPGVAGDKAPPAFEGKLITDVDVAF